MRVRVFAKDVAVTPSVEGLIERRLGFALGRFASQVNEVAVRLEDVNGPRGGMTSTVGSTPASGRRRISVQKEKEGALRRRSARPWTGSRGRCGRIWPAGVPGGFARADVLRKRPLRKGRPVSRCPGAEEPGTR